MQKNEIRIFSNTIYKNLKWIKDLNVRPGTTKLLEESIGQILFNINHSNIFLVPSPTVKETKAKIDKLNLIKCKNFCTAKEAINKTKNNLWNSRKYKWCDQQGINLQTIQAAFKFEEIPNSRAWAANCSVSDFKMLLTVIHSKTFFFFHSKTFLYCDFMLMQTSLSLSHTYTHIQRHTWETTVLWNKCYSFTVLQYFLLYMFYFSSYKRQNDGHKPTIDIMIHWLYLQFPDMAPHCHPFGLGFWSMLASLEELHCCFRFS